MQGALVLHPASCDRRGGPSAEQRQWRVCSSSDSRHQGVKATLAISMRPRRSTRIAIRSRMRRFAPRSTVSSCAAPSAHLRALLLTDLRNECGLVSHLAQMPVRVILRRQLPFVTRQVQLQRTRDRSAGSAQAKSAGCGPSRPCLPVCVCDLVWRLFHLSVQPHVPLWRDQRRIGATAGGIQNPAAAHWNRKQRARESTMSAASLCVCDALNCCQRASCAHV